jgi:hypothetical protein
MDLDSNDCHVIAIFNKTFINISIVIELMKKFIAIMTALAVGGLSFIIANAAVFADARLALN